MSISFANAPLLEIIAELRWGVAAPLLTGAPPTLVLGDARAEEFFMRLGGALYDAGFRQSERLLPPGLPTIPGQPVFRYRSSGDSQRSVLYQVGPDVFSANAIPPYHSWEDFAPSVRSGVEALLRSRGSDAPFTQITLRYIDLFSDEFLQGRSIESFMAAVLGISIGLPASLREVASSETLESVALKVVVPVKIGNLSLSWANGKANNRDGLVMDTTLISTAGTSPDVDAVMAVLNAAHEITNKVFVEITKPIHDIMRPRERAS